MYEVEFIVSTRDGVWRFDPDTRHYSPYEPIAGMHHVKAVSVEQHTGRIAFQQPEESWWSHHVRLLRPEGSIGIADMNVYKVRWLSENSSAPAAPATPISTMATWSTLAASCVNEDKARSCI